MYYDYFVKHQLITIATKKPPAGGLQHFCESCTVMLPRVKSSVQMVLQSWACCSATGSLTKAAGYIILGPLVPGVGEDIRRRAVLYQLAVEKKGGIIGHPGGLVHIVGHYYNCILFFQSFNQFFYLQSGNRVEGRAGFVHE